MTFVVDRILPELLEALQSHAAVVLEAPPGTGKTTRVPPALMRALAQTTANRVVVLEPRRLAARLAASWVAEQAGRPLGETVGYQVRFERVSGPDTRVLYVTEALLVRQMLSDPQLSGIGAVIIDEFHERHLSTDLALLLVRRLQLTSRPDLKLVVMSATLDPAPLAAYLGDCPVLSVRAPQFEVVVDHAREPSRRPLAEQIAKAVQSRLNDTADGDLLVFLPGAAAIRRAIERSRPLINPQRVALLSLYGSQPFAEQQRALARQDKRKVIFSTNVAESALTISGVRGVIDSGLHKLAGHAAWSGLSTLLERPISRASAIQRAGRAGREAPGHCLRLYTEHDFITRREADEPELRRAELSETLLLLRALGLGAAQRLPWYESPRPEALEQAEHLLHDLGALAPDGALTPLGQRMSEFALHPRQSRLLLAAADAGIVCAGAIAAAVLAEGNLGGSDASAAGDVDCDLSELVEGISAAAAQRFESRRCAEIGLPLHRAEAIWRVARRFEDQLLRTAGTPAAARGLAGEWSTRLRESLLLAYPDRVGRRVGTQIALVGGAQATLDRSSQVRSAPYLLALDAEEGRGSGGRTVTIRRASAIEPDWLLDRFPEAMDDRLDARWDADRLQATVESQLCYRDLVIDSAPARGEAALAVGSEMLKSYLASADWSSVLDTERLAQLRARVALVRQALPELALPSLDDAQIRAALLALADGLLRLSDLRERDPWSQVLGLLGAKAIGELRQLAPESLTLPGGRRLTIHYDADKPPWAQSRLQDFFGLQQTPRLCSGRVELVLHLLAPNQRAVQVTTDLAGFWSRHYPGLRNQLQRRYPKHDWPEDGATATPPPPGGRRRSR